MDLMKENSILHMVEIGPSNVLGGLGKRHLKDVKISQVSSADQIKYWFYEKLFLSKINL